MIALLIVLSTCPSCCRDHARARTNAHVCFALDDEPKDGPNQYIYLSGFYSVGLLHALDEVGIRIDTITNVSCDNVNETKQLFEEMVRRDRQEQTLKADVLKEIRTYAS